MEYFVLTDKGLNDLNPADAANRVLSRLEDFHHLMFSERAADDFLKTYIEPLMRSKTIDLDKYWRGAAQAGQLTHYTGGEKIKAPEREAVIRIAIFHCRLCVLRSSDKDRPSLPQCSVVTLVSCQLLEWLSVGTNVHQVRFGSIRARDRRTSS